MTTFKWLIIIFFTSYMLTFTSAQIIRNEATLKNISEVLQEQKRLAKKREQALFGIFNQPLTTNEKQCLEYLYAYMPLSDLADYDGNYFLKTVQMALKGKKEMPWGDSIPENVFLNFVLPVRVNNENLDNFRELEYDELKERVKGLSLRRAALEVNHWCHEKMTYRGSDERTSSPLASLKTSFGRCGEESTFAVTALRTLCIPARQVYTPRWAHSDDNHAWVEVWVDGRWQYMGACEPSPQLNMGWFAEPARRAMLIHTRAYGFYNGDEPVLRNEKRFAELNLISLYAKTKKITIKVVDRLQQPINNALVEFKLYNYAEFYPLAKILTDKNGFCELTSGCGDLFVWVKKNNKFSFQRVSVGKSDTVVISFPQNISQNYKQDLDLVVPVQDVLLPTPVSQTQVAENDRKLRLEDSLRSCYMSTFKDTTWIRQLSKKINLPPQKLIKIFTKAYGNWGEIEHFLQTTETKKLPWAMVLLENISEKDIRDTRSVVLHDHLDNTSFLDKMTKGDSIIFAENVLSGRVSNEMMREWRRFLQQQFDDNFRSMAKRNINQVVDWIKSNIKIDEIANLHSRSPLSPKGVYDLRIADKHSRDIFFVALCRALGIPSRLNSVTGFVQYFRQGKWNDITFEPTVNVPQKGFVHFVNHSRNLDPRYTVNFTIARMEDADYKTIDFQEGLELSKFDQRITLEAGKYYLVTGNRQQNGDVLSSIRFFDVKPNRCTNLQVEIREKATEKTAWGKIDPTKYTMINYVTKSINTLGKTMTGKEAIIVWIDPDKEPSKHVMADIPAVTKNIQDWGGSLLFLLPDGKITNFFEPECLKNLPSSQKQYLIDENNNLLRKIEQIQGHVLSFNLPIILLMDKNGNLFYFSEGYTIGIGDKLKTFLK